MRSWILKRNGLIGCLLIILLLTAGAYSKAEAYTEQVRVRIKDLVTVQGNNNNQVIGYGLVTGLDGTGDRSKTLSSAMMSNMFSKMGIALPESEMSRLQTKNTAVVMVTADLPASFRSGDTIDVTISSIGDAQSVEGGVLLLTALNGPDGNVYATAQGPITTGSEGEGRRTSRRKLVGIVPGGGLICRSMDANIIRSGEITLVLRSPDFATADRVAQAINSRYGRIARTNGDKFVIIDAVSHLDDPAGLMSRLGELEVVPDTIARVVVNERTGTVVMGANVKILPVVISHANLTLKVTKTPSTPSMTMRERELMGDEKAPVMADTAEIEAAPAPIVEHKRLISIGGDATVKDVIDALNYLEIPPRDLITILQSLKRAGALQAELEVI